MNYTYRLPIFEAPGDAFAKMSDDQFADYKQKNPGGADKADRVRKQAQARANKSNTSTKKGGPLAKRGSNSQGSQSNKGGALVKRQPGALVKSDNVSKAVDMGVVDVKVRDVTPEKKISGSGNTKGSSSSSSSSSDSSGGQRRPPSGAGKKDMTRQKGGPLAKVDGKKPGTQKPKGKGGMKLRSKAHLAAKAIGWAAGVARDTIGGTVGAFGKSSWKEGITYQQYVDTVVPILESARDLQEKPGDGYIGPTMNVSGRQVGVPNPIRVAQDAADTANRTNQKKVDTLNKISPGSASMPNYKLHNKQNSTASQTLFGFRKEAAAWQRKEGKNKKGGLNEKGRKSYERENPGSDLKAPQPEGGPRKRSFCARMGGVKGPMKKPNGEPTRKALALRKWKC
jgi:hypothetical protein